MIESVAQVVSPEAAEEAKAEARSVLRMVRGLEPEEPDTFQIEAIDQFDPQFFSIAPREAIGIDGESEALRDRMAAGEHISPEEMDVPTIVKALEANDMEATCSLGLGFDNDINSDDPESVARGEETLMSALADAGTGNFYYLPHLRALAGVFADEHRPALDRRRRHDDVGSVQVLRGVALRHPGPDLLEVTGFHGGAPCLRFVRKEGNVLSVTGEKVTEDQIVAAMADHTSHHRGALTVYARLRGKTPAMPYG